MRRRGGGQFKCESCATSCRQFAVSQTDLGILVGGDRREGRLGEGEGLEDAPADAEQVVSLDDVEARVVAMHGVQNNLQNN